MLIEPEISKTEPTCIVEITPEMIQAGCVELVVEICRLVPIGSGCFRPNSDAAAAVSIWPLTERKQPPSWCINQDFCNAIPAYNHSRSTTSPCMFMPIN